MDAPISLTDWLKKYEKGEFDSADVDTMIDAGWYDWFCKDSSLYRRLKSMVGMVKAVAASDLVNPDEVYVIFKNNLPLDGKTYDSINICELEGDRNTIWWITAKDGHSGNAIVVKAPNLRDEFNLIGPVGNANTVKRFFKNTSEADLSKRIHELSD